MKRFMFLMILLVAVIVTGCESGAEKEAKEACKNQLKEYYAHYNDDTITSCLADYSKEEKKVVFTYCINKEGTIYEGYSSKYTKDDPYYQTFLSHYNQTKDELNGNEDYYAFEFEASELK